MSWDSDDDDWEKDAADLTLPGLKKEPVVADTFSDEEEGVDFSDEIAATERSKPKKKDDSKLKAKLASKNKKKELEAELAAEAERAKNLKPLTKEEKIAEKLRLQKLVEESDNAITNDLFNAKKEEGKLDADAIAALLQSIPLNDESDYKDFAAAVGKRVEVEDKPFLAKEFVKELCRAVGRSVSGEDLAEVISVLGVVKNEKVKTQLNKKKKKGGKKFANVSRNDMDDDLGGGRGVGGHFQTLSAADELDGDFM
mmetsp:Transcript_1300/g.1641  ORF Transcript_1300/g.1641 Transcript_1300/m.1641 type:complete len:255 (+) Transcript_1300:449-1213(+)|eukprot:CAMPEP_0203758650 /NCGR_PEP_ID=MMETSP0098-20131031/11499_1 /ASSEMBLY_ACC=CAM_ASM_000208 /TAXON_ID=96639 /ORGANISM=" , Strain NY0313808BC1" /LENGTH=254 /DNA_ID=CAMNT_0050651191 /DNA_START=425 /DNA_END=1189 /DNA_ORIENTATION=-